MTVWLINGYTTNIGLWEVELYSTEEEAMHQFSQYVNEYNAKVNCEGDSTVALCFAGKFYLEKRTF